MKNFIKSKAFPFIAGGVIIAIIGGVAIGLKMAEKARVGVSLGVETGVETGGKGATETPSETIKNTETPVDGIEVVAETPVEVVETSEGNTIVTNPEIPTKDTPVPILPEPIDSSNPSITTSTDVKTEAIPFEKVKENDNTLEIGNQMIVRNGVNGIRAITYRITYTDGKETGKIVVSNVVNLEPVSELTRVGTKPSTVVITVRDETKIETIAFETTTQNDASLEKGTQVVSQAGSEGIKTIVYSVTYTDNKETSRQVKTSAITKAPVNKVVRMGTKESEVVENQDEIYSSKVQKGLSSGYTAKFNEGMFVIYKGTTKVGIIEQGGIFANLSSSKADLIAMIGGAETLGMDKSDALAALDGFWTTKEGVVVGGVSVFKTPLNICILKQ